MKKIEITETQELRKKHNSELIRRMKDGESLKSFDSTASWFPPRPVIEKDPSALGKLYGYSNVDRRLATREEDCSEEKTIEININKIA